MRIPIFRLEYTEEDITFVKEEIEKVLRSGHITMSSRVRMFEKQFADYCKVKYALGTNSGTSSLEIILRAIGVEDQTVVMPSNTYMATPMAAIKAGGRVIFTECERNNLQMDSEDLKKKIREDTKAVILVHIGGIISPSLEEIRKICQDYQIPLVEDAAHAHGAEYFQTSAGNLGIAGSFSFYPTKVLTTAEGGMITTNDEKIYEKSIVLREHGKADHNYNIHTEIGDNWRFSEVHAVLGIQQMKKAEYILSERRRLAKYYDELLRDIEELECIVLPSHVKSSFYKYIVFLPEHIKRSNLKSLLLDKFNIELPGEVYSHPCHSQPVFSKYPEKLANDNKDKFPVTNYVCQQHICLPLYPGLKNEEVDYIVSSMKQILSSL